MLRTRPGSCASTPSTSLVQRILSKDAEGQFWLAAESEWPSGVKRWETLLKHPGHIVRLFSGYPPRCTLRAVVRTLNMVHHVSRIHPHPSSPEDRRRRRQHLQLQFLRADLTISVWGDNILIGWMSRYDASASGEGQDTVERCWFGYAESPFQRIRISFVYNLLGMCKGLHLVRTVVLVWDWGWFVSRCSAA